MEDREDAALPCAVMCNARMESEGFHLLREECTHTRRRGKAPTPEPSCPKPQFMSEPTNTPRSGTCDHHRDQAGRDAQRRDLEPTRLTNWRRTQRQARAEGAGKSCRAQGRRGRAACCRRWQTRRSGRPHRRHRQDGAGEKASDNARTNFAKLREVAKQERLAKAALERQLADLKTQQETLQSRAARRGGAGATPR